MALFGARKKAKASPTAQDDRASKGPAATDESASPEGGRLQFSEQDITAARKWFKQATKLVENRNYDYAIECFLTGLKFWPEAVEEGHQRLRAAAVARRETGGKKPGKLEEMKHPMTGKDPLQAMLNAEWRWTRDPGNLSYIAGMVKNAAKAGCEETLLFIGPIYFDAAKTAKKLSKDPFVLLLKSYQDRGELCEERGDLKRAIQFFEGALTVLQVLRTMVRTNREYDQQLTNLATRMTIMKGKYDSAGDFRDSMKDSDAQKEIHDRERMVMDEKRLDELIAEARADWQANPTVPAKLLSLVDLLCREEVAEHEIEAIKLLETEHESADNYSYKSRADDVRMKQLRRQTRKAAAGDDKQAARQAQVDQLKFELNTFKERVEKYPTDNKFKFEYGKRLVQARKYDLAIPMLQEARNDPKNRLVCMLLIGRSFFEKGLGSQAVAALNQAIEEHELGGDDLGKELHYWLGRASEGARKTEEAIKAYGQVIQWDYNYRDVRDRLAQLEE